MLDSGLEHLLDPAASDEILAEVRPALSHLVHGPGLCVADHVLHLVHVVFQTEWRGVLTRVALVGRDVLEVVDVLFAHGYIPLIST